MTGSVRQWKRVAEVTIGKAGKGLLVTDLRIQFEVTKTVDSTPNAAIIKIFNLAPSNEAQIKNVYDEVVLRAGYVGAVQQVFRGNIKHVYRYREANDYITEIEAGDGEKDYKLATMNETLAAGTTSAQIVDRAVASFGGIGDTKKGVIQTGASGRVRGKVVSGNTRNVLDDVAKDSGANWSIQDGQLTIVKTAGVLPGEAIVITTDTGMLNAPEINERGIAVTCLLNPLLQVNGRIKLDNAGIKAKRQKALALGKKLEAQKAPVRLDPDGIYKVIKLTHKGDTRGNDWKSETECVGLVEPIPEARSA
jgi:hypothetical protein